MNDAFHHRGNLGARGALDLGMNGNRALFYVPIDLDASTFVVWIPFRCGITIPGGQELSVGSASCAFSP